MFLTQDKILFHSLKTNKTGLSRMNDCSATGEKARMTNSEVYKPPQGSAQFRI